VKERRSKPEPAVTPRVEQLRYDIGDLIHRHNLPAAVQKYRELRELVPQAVLTAPDQLDIANQLMAEARHKEAAAAYEDYLRLYPNTAQHEQVMLILALIYTQHVPNPERAVQILRTAIPRLHDPNQRAFAEEELARLTAKQNP
jgi:outer membrane protein assembly factor BamD (BamD/ComL family)